MKKVSSYLLVMVVLFAAVSCTNQEYKKTKSGLLYKIISDGKGEPAKKGQFLKMSVIEKIRDSVLYSTLGSVPIYMPVDSPRPVYSHTEILSLLRKGDSAVVVILADTLLKKSGGQLPPFLKKKDKIIIAFKVLDLFPSEDLLAADRTQEMAKEKDREVKTVENYLADNKINAQKTDKGVYVLVQSPGEGAQADSGKQVSVRYTGKLFPSGKVFETNADDTSKQPLKFVVGAQKMIQGMDDGVRKFKKGGKGTLYIPAYLAYDQQPGPGHKPYEDLIFDVEIVDVTDAPKEEARPAMPQMPQGMPQGMPQRQPQQHR